MKQRCLSILKYLPIFLCFLCLIFILCYLNFNDEISVQTILDYTPDNLLTASLILLILYAVKSMTIVFPIIILEVAVGHLFTTIPAIIINSLGILIGFIISYFTGYFSGSNAVKKLVKKYPALDNIIKTQSKNSFFTCFFLRTLCILPGDAVSICLGAVKFPFRIYLIASMLGSFPRTILATLFGSSVTEPTSPMFWISIVLMTLYSGVTLLIYKRNTKESYSITRKE